MASINEPRKVLLIQNAEKQIQRLNNNMQSYLSEQPQIASQINYETNQIYTLKSKIKKLSDSQLLLNEEANKAEKKVKNHQKK